MCSSCTRPHHSLLSLLPEKGISLQIGQWTCSHCSGKHWCRKRQHKVKVHHLHYPAPRALCCPKITLPCCIFTLEREMLVFWGQEQLKELPGNSRVRLLWEMSGKTATMDESSSEDNTRSNYTLQERWLLQDPIQHFPMDKGIWLSYTITRAWLVCLCGVMCCLFVWRQTAMAFSLCSLWSQLWKHFCLCRFPSIKGRIWTQRNHNRKLCQRF